MISEDPLPRGAAAICDDSAESSGLRYAIAQGLTALPADQPRTTGGPLPYMDMVTVTTHTKKINPDGAPEDTSAPSATKPHPYVLTPRDGHSLGVRPAVAGSSPRFRSSEADVGNLVNATGVVQAVVRRVTWRVWWR